MRKHGWGAVVVLAVAIDATAADRSEPVRSIADILALPRAELHANRPALVRGVVTAIPDFIVIEDAGRAIYVSDPPADLALVGVSRTGSDAFTTNVLSSFADIGGGGSSQFSIYFDPTGIMTSGTQTRTFTISMRDKTGLSGGIASNSLTVLAEVVVVPEPATVILAAAGIGIGLAARLRRRRK